MDAVAACVRPDGSEVLRTIDGYRLEVDTEHGVAVVAPNEQRRSATGIFLVNLVPEPGHRASG